MANTYEYKPHTNPDRERRRALAQAMMQRGLSAQAYGGGAAPIYGKNQQVSDLVQTLSGALMNRKLAGEETADRDAYNKTMAEALRGPQAPVDGMGPVEDKNEFLIKTLAGNEQTAPLALERQFGRLERQDQEAQRRLETSERMSQQKELLRYGAGLERPSDETWNNPVDEVVGGKEARVQYSNRGNRRIVEGAAPKPKAAAQPGAITQDEDGNMVITPGGKMTDAQSKSVTYNVRATGALKNLEKIEESGYDPANAQDRFADSAPIMGNSMLTGSGQQYKQAASEFLAAILRKDTGASVTKEEWKVYGEQFFPRYGDGAEVKKQKAGARRRALDALQAGVGIGSETKPQAEGGGDSNVIEWNSLGR